MSDATCPNCHTQTAIANDEDEVPVCGLCLAKQKERK